MPDKRASALTANVAAGRTIEFGICVIGGASEQGWLPDVGSEFMYARTRASSKEFACFVRPGYCGRSTRYFGRRKAVAKRTVLMLIDDLDGGDADETIAFGIDGTQYEIDLSAKNATTMREALARYVKAGTRVGRSSTSPARPASGRGRAPARVDRDQNRAIREWAHNKGIDVSDRGRIKQDVVDRYHAEAGR
jgi:hypothetical protein